MNMKIQPIKILIKDDKEFENVALLVDRNDFLSDIGMIRKKIGLSKLLLLSHHKKVQRVMKKLMSEVSKRTRKELHKALNNQKNELNKISTETFMKSLSKEERQLLDKHEDQFLSKEYRSIVRNIVRKYREYDIFKYYPIVSNAIIYGIIPNNERLKSWFYLFNDKREDFIHRLGFNNPYIKICISNRITKSEFADIYKDLKKLLYKPPDTITNIRRDRKWYWMHKNGMSYARILGTTTNISKQGVIEAIKQYKKRLAIQV